ncbi:MAG: hypothetical protein AAF725_04370 [Acidobacteriota bacterium]
MARKPTPVNIRNFSVKCGRCGEYQVLVSYEPSGDWNVYHYECEWPPCNEEEHRARTVLEVPGDLDEFAARDQEWRGGRVHAGAEAGEEPVPADSASGGEPDELLPVIPGD